MVGEIADVAGSGGGDACFDGGVWLSTGLDAVEEVAHVGDGAVFKALFFQGGIAVAFYSFAMDAHAGTVELDSDFGSAELDTAIGGSAPL